MSQEDPVRDKIKAYALESLSFFVRKILLFDLILIGVGALVQVLFG